MQPIYIECKQFLFYEFNRRAGGNGRRLIAISHVDKGNKFVIEHANRMIQTILPNLAFMKKYHVTWNHAVISFVFSIINLCVSYRKIKIARYLKGMTKSERIQLFF